MHHELYSQFTKIFLLILFIKPVTHGFNTGKAAYSKSADSGDDVVSYVGKSRSKAREAKI